MYKYKTVTILKYTSKGLQQAIQESLDEHSKLGWEHYNTASPTSMGVILFYRKEDSYSIPSVL
jgi:hypothetical protein